MPISADHIRTALTAYLGTHPKEMPGLRTVLSLLDRGVDLTSRTEFPVHATAGAILVRPDSRILHVHHLALDKWLLPGGHLEPEDENLQAAALRELAEETGMETSAIEVTSGVPLHIDVHVIPANDAKGEPEHRHVDFRYLFRTVNSGISALQTEEVSDALWLDPAAIVSASLRRRVATALR